MLSNYIRTLCIYTVITTIFASGCGPGTPTLDADLKWFKDHFSTMTYQGNCDVSLMHPEIVWSRKQVYKDNGSWTMDKPNFQVLEFVVVSEALMATNWTKEAKQTDWATKVVKKRNYFAIIYRAGNNGSPERFRVVKNDHLHSYQITEYLDGTLPWNKSFAIDRALNDLGALTNEQLVRTEFVSYWDNCDENETVINDGNSWAPASPVKSVTPATPKAKSMDNNNPCDKALKLLADNQFYNAKLTLKDCIEDESNPHRQDAMKLWTSISMVEKDNATAFIKRLIEAAGAKGQAEQLLATLPEVIDNGGGDLDTMPEVLIPMWRNQLKAAVTSEEVKTFAKSLDGANE